MLDIQCFKMNRLFCLVEINETTIIFLVAVELDGVDGHVNLPATVTATFLLRLFMAKRLA
jgi:hypothetical protein